MSGFFEMSDRIKWIKESIPKKQSIDLKITQKQEVIENIARKIKMQADMKKHGYTTNVATCGACIYITDNSIGCKKHKTWEIESWDKCNDFRGIK